jgi:hypothetical protein
VGFEALALVADPLAHFALVLIYGDVVVAQGRLLKVFAAATVTAGGGRRWWEETTRRVVMSHGCG